VRLQQIVVCVFLWAVLVGTTVGAVPTPLDMPEAGLAMTIPSGWTAATEGTRYVVTSPTGAIVMVFVVVEAGHVDAALAAIKQNQLHQLSSVRTAGRSQYHLNGLAIIEEHGTAVTTDGLSLWKLAVVTAMRPVLVYTLTSPTVLRTHERAYAQLQQSFHRFRTRPRF